jgi:hypothetical protein
VRPGEANAVPQLADLRAPRRFQEHRPADQSAVARTVTNQDLAVLRQIAARGDGSIRIGCLGWRSAIAENCVEATGTQNVLGGA